MFTWGHQRNYDSLLITDGGSESPSLNGYRWHSETLGPYIKVSGSDIALYLNGSSKRTFVDSMGTFVPPADYLCTLVKSGSSTAEVYTLTELDTGNIFIFYGFDTDIDFMNRGRLKERTNREYFTQGLSGTEYAYDVTYGYVTQVTTADPQGWIITYSYFLSGTEAGPAHQNLDAR